MRTKNSGFEVITGQRDDRDRPAPIRSIFQRCVQQFGLFKEGRQRHYQVFWRTFFENSFDITRSVTMSKFLFQFCNTRFLTHSDMIFSQSEHKVDNWA